MRVWSIIRALFAPALLAVAVWAFMPPDTEEQEGQLSATALEIGDPEARFQIEIAPGPYYMPGVIPQGLGGKNRGLVIVAEKFVEQFPDTRIIFRNVPTTDREWLVTSMAGDQAPDILMANVEDIWVDIQKDWYLALDRYLEAPNPFVPEGEPGSEQWWDMFRYQAISRAKAAPIDGKMYCITFDMVETGVFYNKSKFEALGIEPPATWAEFMAMQEKIQDAGYTPFVTVVEAIADWGVDVIFDQLYWELLPGIDLVKDPLREEYLEGYLDWDEIVFLLDKGFFTSQDPRYREIYRIMREWRQYWNKDLSVRTMDRTRPFIRQEALMNWDASWFVHRLAMDKTLPFDWGVFYLPPITKETSRFAPDEIVRTCVIGGAGQQFAVTKQAWDDTKDPATSQQVDRVIKFLQFVCVPENAELIINESLQFIPNIVGVEARPEMQPFVDILDRRYTTTKWTATFDLQYVDVLQRMMSLFMNGGCDLDGFLTTMDYFIKQAARRAVERKEPDLDRLEHRWEELTPVRAGMEGLPDGVR